MANESALTVLIQLMVFYCMWCYCCGRGRKGARSGADEGSGPYEGNKALPIIGGRLDEDSYKGNAGDKKKKKKVKKNSKTDPAALLATAATANGGHSDENERLLGNGELDRDGKLQPVTAKGHVSPDISLPYIDADAEDLCSSKDKSKTGTAGRFKKRLFGSPTSITETTVSKKVTLYNKNQETLSKQAPAASGDDIYSDEGGVTSLTSTPGSMKSNKEWQVSKMFKRFQQAKDSGEGAGFSPGRKSTKSNVSEVKSEDFVPVLETALRNEREAEELHKSFLKRLTPEKEAFNAERSITPGILRRLRSPDEVDEADKELSLQRITEELRRVGEPLLVANGTAEPTKQAPSVLPKPVVGTAWHQQQISLHQLESPDSGLEAVAAVSPASSEWPSKVHSDTSGYDLSSGYTSPVPFTKTGAESTAPIILYRTRCVDEHGSRRLHIDPGRSPNLEVEAPCVTTTITQTGSTTVTEVSKMFSGHWKELDIVRTTRTTAASPSPAGIAHDQRRRSSDELQGLNLTVSSEEGEAGELVNESSRLVSKQVDHRVASEYLTNLSHMLIDDCRQFHENGADVDSLRHFHIDSEHSCCEGKKTDKYGQEYTALLYNVADSIDRANKVLEEAQKQNKLDNDTGPSCVPKKTITTTTTSARVVREGTWTHQDHDLSIERSLWSCFSLTPSKTGLIESDERSALKPMPNAHSKAGTAEQKPSRSGQDSNQILDDLKAVKVTSIQTIYSWPPPISGNGSREQTPTNVLQYQKSNLKETSTSPTENAIPWERLPLSEALKKEPHGGRQKQEIDRLAFAPALSESPPPSTSSRQRTPPPVPPKPNQPQQRASARSSRTESSTSDESRGNRQQHPHDYHQDQNNNDRRAAPLDQNANLVQVVVPAQAAPETHAEQRPSQRTIPERPPRSSDVNLPQENVHVDVQVHRDGSSSDHTSALCAVDVVPQMNIESHVTVGVKGARQLLDEARRRSTERGPMQKSSDSSDFAPRKSSSDAGAGATVTRGDSTSTDEGVEKDHDAPKDSGKQPAVTGEKPQHRKRKKHQEHAQDQHKSRKEKMPFHAAVYGGYESASTTSYAADESEDPSSISTEPPAIPTGHQQYSFEEEVGEDIDAVRAKQAAAFAHMLATTSSTASGASHPPAPEKEVSIPPTNSRLTAMTATTGTASASNTSATATCRGNAATVMTLLHEPNTGLIDGMQLPVGRRQFETSDSAVDNGHFSTSTTDEAAGVDLVQQQPIVKTSPLASTVAPTEHYGRPLELAAVAGKEQKHESPLEETSIDEADQRNPLRPDLFDQQRNKVTGETESADRDLEEKRLLALLASTSLSTSTSSSSSTSTTSGSSTDTTIKQTVSVRRETTTVTSQKPMIAVASDEEAYVDAPETVHTTTTELTAESHNGPEHQRLSDHEGGDGFISAPSSPLPPPASPGKVEEATVLTLQSSPDESAVPNSMEPSFDTQQVPTETVIPDMSISESSSASSGGKKRKKKRNGKAGKAIPENTQATKVQKVAETVSTAAANGDVRAKSSSPESEKTSVKKVETVQTESKITPAATKSRGKRKSSEKTKTESGAKTER